MQIFKSIIEAKAKRSAQCRALSAVAIMLNISASECASVCERYLLPSEEPRQQ